MTKKTAVESHAVDPFHAFVEFAAGKEMRSPGQAGAILHGVTVAIKDNIGVRNLSFTAGHPLFGRRRAADDSVVVTRLREAGVSVVGVTRTDAGGFGVTTPEVLNPVAPHLIVGGSSGGSAAAVAAGMADLGLGTDTGGSCRIPAACTGIFGFKPTFGAVPTEGIWPMAPSMDHIGVMARTLAFVERATVALLQRPLHTSDAEFVVGFDAKALAACDEPQRAAFRQTLDRLRCAGVVVRGLTLPDLRTVAKVHGVLVLAEAWDLYAPVWPQQAERLGPAAMQALRIAASLDSESVARARRQAEVIKAQVANVLDQVDVLLAPTLPVSPPQRGQQRVPVNGTEVPVVHLMVQQTCLANLCGIPALSAPWMLSGKLSLRPSLQIMAAAGRDDVVLNCARRFAALLAKP